MHHLIELSKEVEEALDQGRPVVALESTIISHGMPYPQNVEMAQKVEDIIRSKGATPATIAIMDGKIKVGLTAVEIEVLATAKEVIKVSRRDLPIILAQGKMGAATVASTMIGAHLAGIRFFVTGGIGGVHRGFNETMDVSADLEELAMTPVTVICAGAKSILDLPRTLEYLETKGVPVIGYQSETLPAFYTRFSDCKVPYSMQTPEEVAAFIKVKEDLRLGGGNLIANPIPEEAQLDPAYISSVIDKATQEAQAKGILGKEVTPYLLARISELTEGKSLAANIQLVYHNAEVGAAIAVAYSQLAK